MTPNRVKLSASRPIDVAERALRRFRRIGDRVSEVSTPERIVRAAGAACVETFHESVEVFRNGRVENTTVKRKHIRIDDSPLDRLKARGLLAPKDWALNAALFYAGYGYRSLFRDAGLESLVAMDPSKQRVDGGGVLDGMFRSEAQATAFRAYCAASDKMYSDPRRIVDAVVLRDGDVVDAGRAISGYADHKQARAVGMYLLQAGLTSMAVHFGLIPTKSA